MLPPVPSSLAPGLTVDALAGPGPARKVASNGTPPVARRLRQVARDNVTLSLAARAKALKLQGLSVAQIAFRLGVSRMDVDFYLGTPAKPKATPPKKGFTAPKRTYAAPKKGVAATRTGSTAPNTGRDTVRKPMWSEPGKETWA